LEFLWSLDVGAWCFKICQLCNPLTWWNNFACVKDQQNSKPKFWPILFLAAFAVGAVLWALWMSRVIRQTRENRDIGFFVPMNTNPLPTVPTSRAPAITNQPPSQTNSASPAWAPH